MLRAARQYPLRPRMKVWTVTSKQTEAGTAAGSRCGLGSNAAAATAAAAAGTGVAPGARMCRRRSVAFEAGCLHSSWRAGSMQLWLHVQRPLLSAALNM
mmetsp:Transcript_10757/g.32003  ORF Transcript_10757/g.32003 Transcript_10757/m.32003 type:complete len:99 (-) Transcript_10757:96-392(-)